MAQVQELPQVGQEELPRQAQTDMMQVIMRAEVLLLERVAMEIMLLVPMQVQQVQVEQPGELIQLLVVLERAVLAQIQVVVVVPQVHMGRWVETVVNLVVEGVVEITLKVVMVVQESL
jgi:hypothetical protein